MPRLLQTRALGFFTAAALVLGSIGQMLEAGLLGLTWVNEPGSPSGVSFAAIGTVVLTTSLLKLVGSFVLLPAWTTASYANLLRLRAAGLRYTPGQVCAGFFIPFLNMVRPWFALRDLWHASDPGLVVKGRYDRTGWLATEGSPLLTLFWFAFVGSWLVMFFPLWPAKLFLTPFVNAVMAASLVFLLVAIERRMGTVMASLAGGPDLASGLGHVVATDDATR